MAVSLKAWSQLMSLHSGNTFNLNWKKQILAFMLLGFIHGSKKKFKFGLKSIYAAQTIVSELDETVERNLDYLMAVNTLTAYMLLCIDKPKESIEFINIAERLCMQLVDKT